MPEAKLVFIRGLNTYPTEGVFIGPLNLGPADRHLRKAFTDCAVPFVSVPNAGFGDLISQAAKAKAFIQQQLHKDDVAFIVGHSQGGLVARLLAKEPDLRKKISGILTIASPHQGSKLADAVIALRRENPLLYWICRLGAYDTEKKIDEFKTVATQTMKAFNAQNSVSDNHFSIVCSHPHLPLTLKLLPQLARFSEENDGMVTLSSQYWGEAIGHFQLDHLSQLGYATHIQPQLRKRVKANFHSMVELIAEQFRKSTNEFLAR